MATNLGIMCYSHIYFSLGFFSSKVSAKGVQYDKLVPPRPSTRSNCIEPCNCSVCLLARARYHQDTQALLDLFIKPSVSPPKVSSASDIVKICLTCGSLISKGKPHKCKESAFKENTLKLVRQKGDNIKGSITAQLVRDHFLEQNISQRGGTVALPGAPQKMKLTMGAEAAGLLMRPKFFTHQQMIRLAANRNLSDNLTRLI